MNNDLKQNKYTEKVFKDYKREKLPDNFTDKLMGKIHAEQVSVRQTKTPVLKSFIPLYIAVFVVILVLAFIMQAQFSTQEVSVLPEFMNNLPIHLSFNFSGKLFSNSIIFKILPSSILLLLLFDRLLTKFNHQ